MDYFICTIIYSRTWILGRAKSLLTTTEAPRNHVDTSPVFTNAIYELGTYPMGLIRVASSDHMCFEFTIHCKTILLTVWHSCMNGLQITVRSLLELAISNIVDINGKVFISSTLVEEILPVSILIVWFGIWSGNFLIVANIRTSSVTILLIFVGVCSWWGYRLCSKPRYLAKIKSRLY